MPDIHEIKILSFKEHAFYTQYKIRYKGKEYFCNYNGGYPSLEGISISESESYDLSEVIEDYFLNVQCEVA